MIERQKMVNTDNKNLVDKTIKKLSLLGYKILGNNDFCILYRLTSGEQRLVKFTQRGNKVQKQELSAGKRVMIYNNFIIRQDHTNSLLGMSIFIRNTSRNLVSKYKMPYVQLRTEHEGISIENKETAKTVDVILVKTASKLLLINYEGKILDVSAYKVDSVSPFFGEKTLILSGDSLTNIYTLKYIPFYSRFSNGVLRTDKDFSNVNILIPADEFNEYRQSWNQMGG